MEEQKTIREWLETLEEPYRTQAIRNISPGLAGYPKKFKRLSTVLKGAFLWAKSSEKDKYWRKLCYKIEKDEQGNN